MVDDPLVLDSAHRHGIDEADMLHALTWPFGVYTDTRGERPLTMIVGTSRSGHLLIEVGVVQHPHHGACVVHAMEARSTVMRKAGL